MGDNPEVNMLTTIADFGCSRTPFNDIDDSRREELSIIYELGSNSSDSTDPWPKFTHLTVR